MVEKSEAQDSIKKYVEENLLFLFGLMSIFKQPNRMIGL